MLCPKCNTKMSHSICYECGYYREDCNGIPRQLLEPTINGVKFCNICKRYHDPKKNHAVPPIKKKRVKGHVNQPKRTRIFNRDGNKCLRCGSEENLTIDHIKAVSKGGKNDDHNLQTLCFDCNQLKGTSSNNYIVNFVATSRIRKINHEVRESRKKVTMKVIYLGPPVSESWVLDKE